MTFGPSLQISLTDLVANYRLLASKAKGAECAAVIKANAYGIGALAAFNHIARAGCKTFFVAALEEAIELAESAREQSAVIYVLNGFAVDEYPRFKAGHIRPVINTLEDLKSWHRTAPDAPFALHLDTGFNRLGLSEQDDEQAAAILRAPASRCQFLMSHFACADDPCDPMTQTQHDNFLARIQSYPDLPLSLANSAATVTRENTYLDLVRPGLALYGEQPASGHSIPLQPVISLTAPVLQIRDVHAGESIGYGGDYRATKRMPIAVVGAGYADGIPRSLSNCGQLIWQDTPLPIVGRVSMDSLTVDCSQAPNLTPGDRLTVIGPHRSASDFGAPAGISAYEILTRLAPRTRRVYVE